MRSWALRPTVLSATAALLLATPVAVDLSGPNSGAAPAPDGAGTRPMTPSTLPLPVPDNLDVPAEDLLPARISAADPVSVVSVTHDQSGRPIITTTRATSTTMAVRAVRAAQAKPNAVAVELDSPTSVASNDPFFSSMWNLATLSMAEVWPVSTGAGVTVAVIDTGVQANHPDLAGVVLPGTDVIDSTGDGRTDANGHGTHVAGTIAALVDNNLGVAGVAPTAKILPVRVLDANGSGTNSGVAAGIVWAADHGAQVLNMSLRSTAQSAALTSAVAYARGKGITIVAAAGNDRTAGSPTAYPAADAGVIAVAATDSTDTDAYFSNVGGYVDVAAPGVSITSTSRSGGYAIKSGTSMASPHVAAAAALILAARPGTAPDEVERLLTSTALDLGQVGRDDRFGSGRIRPLAALAALTPAPSASASASASATPSESPSLTPSGSPSLSPSASPGSSPSGSPTESATASPSVDPTSSASATPTASPTSTPAPSPSAGKVRPVTQLTAGPSSVVVNSTVTTRFTVLARGSRWASRPASLCVATSPTLTAYQCAAVTTSSTGTVTYTRVATAGYRVFLRVDATAESDQTVSRAQTYRVRSVAKLSKAGKHSLRLRVTGATGQTMSLQRYQNRAWVTVTTVRASASRTVTNLRAGYAYRLRVASSPMLDGGYSPSVRL